MSTNLAWTRSSADRVHADHGRISIHRNAEGWNTYVGGRLLATHADLASAKRFAERTQR